MGRPKGSKNGVLMEPSEYTSRHYAKRRLAGLCLVNGCKNAPEIGMTRCADCAQHDRDRSKSLGGRYSSLKKVLKKEGVDATSFPLDIYARLVSNAQCIWCFRLLSEASPCGHGLDKLDLTGKHTKDNVSPCCGECNRIRSNAFTVAEMQEFLAPAIRAIFLRRQS